MIIMIVIHSQKCDNYNLLMVFDTLGKNKNIKQALRKKTEEIFFNN
jgi:hypothetical protein